MNTHPAIVNLAADPEEKSIGGKQLVEIRVADSTYGKNDETMFYNVTLSGGSAATARRLKKGDQVMVNGTLSQRSYTNKRGEKVTILEMKFGEIKQVIKSPSFFSTAEDSAEDADDAPDAVDDPLADV